MRDWRLVSTSQIKTGEDESKVRLLSHFARDFKQVMSRELCISCKSKFESEYRLFIKTAYNMSEVKNSGWVAKKMYQGLQLEFNSGIILARTGISNEVAEKFARKSWGDKPNGLHLFDKIPEDFELEQEPSEVDNLVSENNKEQLEEMVAARAEALEIDAVSGTKAVLAEWLVANPIENTLE